MWIGLGVGGAALLLCCVGGVFGFGALVVVSERALPAQARTVVQDYLDGLASGDYTKAYDQVCTRRQNVESLSQFTEREREYPAIAGFTVGNAVQVSNQFQVPAQVRTKDGDSQTEQYAVVPETGALRVCGGSR
jgi:hypothetical protein